MDVSRKQAYGDRESFLKIIIIFKNYCIVPLFLLLMMYNFIFIISVQYDL